MVRIKVLVMVRFTIRVIIIGYTQLTRQHGHNTGTYNPNYNGPWLALLLQDPFLYSVALHSIVIYVLMS